LNAVEIEEAISQLADQPFDSENFPYTFLEAFGNKETTIKRLRAGASNKSDVGGVLQTNNIHIVTCDTGRITSKPKHQESGPTPGYEYGEGGSQEKRGFRFDCESGIGSPQANVPSCHRLGSLPAIESGEESEILPGNQSGFSGLNRD
jgi:hypothetical protein